MLVKNVILCDEISELEEAGRNTCDILCLTKNPQLYDYIVTTNTDILIKYLEPSKTYMAYTDKAYNIIEQINKEILHACRSKKTYLYTIGCGFDVGDVATQIRDAVMVWEMLNAILGEFDIKMIVCCYHKEYIQEIEGLKFWAMRKNCSCKLISSCKKDLEYLRLRLNGGKIKLLMDVNATMQHFLRFFHCSMRKKNEKKSIYYDIGLVKLGAKQKDYNWTKEYLDLLEQSQISFRIICMNEFNSNQWRKWGYEADNLQGYVTYGKYCRAALEYVKEKRRIWNAIRKKFHEFSNGVLDGDQLKMIILSHLNYNIFDNIVVDFGADMYFKNYFYKLIDYNVSTNYVSSKICYFNVVKYSNRTKFRAAGAGIKILPKGKKYEPFGFISDFRFVLPNEMQEKEIGSERKYPLTKSKYSEEFLNYQFRFEDLYENLRILWAPSYPTMGVTRYSSFRNTGMKLLEIFQYDIGDLYVKFHPNQNIHEVENFIKECTQYSNIVVCENSVNIKTMLDKADICVTNCSLTIIDAAVRKKAIICVVDSIEYELVERHKDGICIITDMEELEKLLKDLAKNPSFRKRWIFEQIQKQNAYFSKFLPMNGRKDDMIQIIKKEMNKI